jgi:hypothetical protein
VPAFPHSLWSEQQTCIGNEALLMNRHTVIQALEARCVRACSVCLWVGNIRPRRHRLVQVLWYIGVLVLAACAWHGCSSSLSPICGRITLYYYVYYYPLPQMHTKTNTDLLGTPTKQAISVQARKPF